MASSGMLRRVALLRTEVTEELSVSIIRMTNIGELETTLALTSNRRTMRRNTKHLIFLRSVRRLLVKANDVPSSKIFITLMKEEPHSSETSVLTRATRRNSPKTPFFKKFLFSYAVTENSFRQNVISLQMYHSWLQNCGN
jgi:hypothetical protein